MNTLLKTRNITLLQRCLRQHLEKVTYRAISTSKPNDDSASAAACSGVGNKDWVSYGFSYEDKEEDTNVHHASYFFTVSLCLVLGGFAWGYAPDTHLKDWSQREAFLELRRREKAGLLPIDPNYIDPAEVKLPSEDELKDVEIII